MMREAPKKNFGIFFLKLTQFDKRWSTIMIMLESSKGGGEREARGRRNILRRGRNSIRPPPSCATEHSINNF